VAERASRLVAPDEPMALVGPAPRFVGRGGQKLEGALERFAVDVEGRDALDAGSSTGGFTDCLLQHGARAVVAVDVGRAQLHERLRRDRRVHLLERTDIRQVDQAALRATCGLTSVSLLTGDLSFISLRATVSVLTGPVVDEHGDLILLIKPQFEAGRQEASRHGGVIRDPEIWRRTVGEVACAVASAGSGIMGAMPSPITGASGNVEFFLHARRGVPGRAPAGIAELLDAAVAEATEKLPGGAGPSG